MNRIKTKRLICTSLSAMVLGTSFFISGIPKVNAYAADGTNIATSTAMPILVGAGKMDGVLKSVQYVNDSNYYGDVVVATITNGNGDYSYFAKVGTQSAEDLKNIVIGQTITINYVTGTPVQCDSKGAFPITSISTAIKQTTYTDSRGVIYQLNENDNTAIINSQTAISGDILIPQQVTANGEQYTVTGIGENAFGKCSNLKSIVIPDSVKAIGRYAFYGCNNLENVILPNNLTAIEERTFSGCSSLKSIILPESIKNVGYHAFYGCSNLLSITIPSSLTFIGTSKEDRLSYVNTFIMDQNNNNFTTEDGVVFSRENPSATATPSEPGIDICGVGSFSGTIKSKKYIQYDYLHDGSSQDYLILTVTDYKGNDSSFFTEKNSDECNEIEKANIGQHIELVCTTGTPIFDSSINYAAPLSSFVLATSIETPATSTVVASSTETVATSTETSATSTTVASSTETATSTTVAGTETAGTATIVATTGTTTAGNAKTGDAASLMTVAMFIAGSAGIMLKKGKK